ncbi:sister chromatid cohesion protein Dcc1 [Mycena floridula]|nr:sister chromatid cohesion protein Dcc1 [Mycena floridula]
MECDLSFSETASADAGSFKLLELPAELFHLIESSIDNLSFTVKGTPGEDAVLCTQDKTYSMRSVILSNSVLVVAPGDFADDGVVICDQVNEILELAPAVPKLHQLATLLRGREYTEADENMEQDDNDSPSRLTYKDAQSIIQASDAELECGLKEKHILNINGKYGLRFIAPEYLNQIIELILTLLVSQSQSFDSVVVEQLTSALADDHEIPRAVSTQIMSWFGELSQGRWKTNLPSIMKEIGLGILRQHKEDTITEENLLAAWKEKVGDTFHPFVSLDSLAGNYLVKTSLSEAETLVYFPVSSLPVDPGARFSDLFLTRTKWRHEDITPFLADIAVNSKERDKLLLKFARATTSPQGVFYTARGQYNG